MTAESELGETLAMIRRSASALAAAGGGVGRARRLRGDARGFDRNVWREMCSQGWSGLCVPESGGGAGLGVRALCALAEELGMALVPEPLVSCALSASLISGPALASLLSGDRVVIPAWQEQANSLGFLGETRFASGRVNGRKVFVLLAAGADAFLVTTNAGTVLVPHDAPGVTVDLAAAVDGTHFGTLTLSDARGELAAASSADQFSAALDAATLATAAMLLGIMQRSFDMTLEYLGTRRQFGRAIGSNQALQHRAVDLKLQIELTRASIESAARLIETSPPAPRRQAVVSRAKARASEAGLLVTRQAVQLHGAIGYTDECDIGLYLRKAMVLANLYGSADVHRARYGELDTDQEEP
jgi:alkylation response protein AidB-like acyl-CoA dehydrogenase